MTTDDVLDVFREAGALLEGHFILSSGLVKSELDIVPDIIVAPAMGGVIPGYETARHLDRDSIFVERVDGEFTLRRGFTLSKGQTVLMVEDIVTTGLSSRECIASLEKTGAKVVAGACLFDRSGGEADIGVPLISLAARSFPAYEADKLPADLQALPAIKPGSRGLS